MTNGPTSPKRVRTAEAARITGLSARTLQEKAAAGLVPNARKIFGRWTYDLQALHELGDAFPSGKATIPGQTPVRIARTKDAEIHAAYERVLSRRSER